MDLNSKFVANSMMIATQARTQYSIPAGAHLERISR